MEAPRLASARIPRGRGAGAKRQKNGTGMIASTGIVRVEYFCFAGILTSSLRAESERQSDREKDRGKERDRLIDSRFYYAKLTLPNNQVISA